MEINLNTACEKRCYYAELCQERAWTIAEIEQTAQAVGRTVLEGEMRCRGPGGMQPATGERICTARISRMTEGLNETEMADVRQALSY